MKPPRFVPDEANFLAHAAREGRTVTYTDMADRFGGIARGWGPNLTAMARRLHDFGLPLLSVLVVSKATGVPSLDARVYRAMGIHTADDMRAEQERCFAHDWTTAAFWKDAP